MGWREKVVERWFGDVVAARVANAVRVLDDEYWTRVSGDGRASLDRQWTAIREDLGDALEAWRSNPLARRIVSLATDYVVGSGIRLVSADPWVQAFVDEWWALNQLSLRCYEWCDELTRVGELFIACRTDQVSGQTFLRAVPSVNVDSVVTDPADLEREWFYHEMVAGDVEGRWWRSPAAEAAGLEGPPVGADSQAPTVPGQVLVHFAINKAVGCVRGEGELTPILPWLARYKDWLENRVRLNKYKTAFLWDVTVRGRAGQADTLRQKRSKYQTAPEPGSIVVHDETEAWQAVSPRLEAWDARDDGKAIRLMVAAGAGIPLHFLSEGESATRATAAEMGDPTFRHYQRPQLYFGQMLTDLAQLAVRRAYAAGRGQRHDDLDLRAIFPDITQRDNLALAQSAELMVRALEGLAQRGWVDAATAVEMAFRFAGELVDPEEVLRRARDEGAGNSQGTGEGEQESA